MACETGVCAQFAVDWVEERHTWCRWFGEESHGGRI
jgi:hypothetical protein